MGELHSLAYTNSLHGSSLGAWDFHNLGIINADTMSLVMDGIAPPFSSPLESDFSTGYLEDALVEFSGRPKRRRLVLYTDEQNKVSDDLLKSYWNLNTIWNHQAENFHYMNQIERIAGLQDEYIRTSMSRISDQEVNIPRETKTPEESIISSSELAPDSSSSSYKDTISSEPPDKEALPSIDPAIPSAGGGEHKRNKRVITRGLVYPFALVKPGANEGEVTLNDINERILMPPTRPVRHPVGDFACRPCVSPDGPGLSGKAVVALTRIQTQGRGTITIIRTKG
ncbi:protein XRI1 [Quillaja saponaria]|uniref:Protein XRI1 n=1 Tax=Quillaja saponaria TaxID=32244 RepID=A0AAD7PGX4_QUISA|nr:protein XRI1 [Quillaja saponaria]